MAILGKSLASIRVKAFFKGTNLFSTLEVSHSMSSLIPISANQKGGWVMFLIRDTFLAIATLQALE
jgi:hypothetical protein